MLLVALVFLFFALGSFAVLLQGYRAVPLLETIPPTPADAPRVSIVVSARDEERAIDGAVRSLLRQDYPDLEVVAVNDRSTDATGDVLRRVAREEPRLRVVEITELPAGWLGKTHGLARGAAAATGEWLLFTDGDVHLQRTALARAMTLVQRRGVDHLAVGPELDIRRRSLALLVNFFIMSFMFFQRPWRAADPRSRDHIGIGAFNLVRRSAYERAGGHARVALRPDDDLKLGKAIKASGGRQLFASGRGFVRVEWYRSVREMTEGLRKNSFAGMEYRLSAAVGAIAALLLVYVLPFAMPFVSEGAARLVWLAVCAVHMGTYAATATSQRSPGWLALCFPLAALLFTWVFARNVFLTVRDGAIEWRGTRYPLAELKKNVV